MEALGDSRACLAGGDENCGVGLGFCKAADKKRLKYGIFWIKLSPGFL